MDRFALLILTSISLLISGCSGGDEGRKTTHAVTGKVTLASTPVAGALVMFTPEGQGQRVATGRTDDDGIYTLTTYDSGDGAIEGPYVVLVTKATEKEAAGDDEEVDHDAFQDGGTPELAHDAEEEEKTGSGSALPGKYATIGDSDLQFTVEAGENTIDLPLEP